MAKKQKKAISERVPSKGQLSKWQRQMRIRRIVIIAAVIFLVGILIWAGYGYYRDTIKPWREVVIKVNGVPFNMEYFVEYFARVLDASTAGMNSTLVYYYANYIDDYIDDEIIDGELLRQGAQSLNCTVTDEEIEARLEEREWPNDRVSRDIVGAALSQQKLNEYFGYGLNATMEQARVEVMLIESQEVANEVTAKIEAGGNFTALVEQFSCNSTIEGDLGWLPREFTPNTLIADAAFNLTAGNISQPIYDKTAIKNIGYWLIEVTDKQDDKINALVMLLGSEEEAEWVKAQLTAGGNFSALAGNYSQHASKTQGGKLDGLKRGDMRSNAFDAVAFNLTVNQVSGPVKDTSVQTTSGYWLVKVVERGDRELEEKVKNELIGKHFNDWFKGWKGNSTIENRLDANKISWAVSKVLQGR